MSQTDIFKSLVNYCGTQIKTAQLLKVDQATVSGWVRGKHGMSPVVALRAEKITNGQFKASELCPALAEMPDIA